jgi:hypothetical protein
LRIGIVGGISLIVIALIAYFAGGYVAGRMSRFDGERYHRRVDRAGYVAETAADDDGVQTTRRAPLRERVG